MDIFKIRRHGLAIMIFGVILTISSCKHHLGLIEDIGIPPANLVYDANFLEVQAGTKGTSPTPTIDGDTTLNFIISTTPITTSSQVFIDSLGIIHIDSTLGLGFYSTTVTVTNSVGAESFVDAFTFEVVSVSAGPTNLLYTPNSASYVLGATTGSSSVPTVNGSTPINYTMVSTPASTEITINANTGVISSTNALTVNTYTIDVTTTNSVGSQTFTSAYTIDVSASATAPSNLLYTPDNVTLGLGVAGTSVSPSVSGTTPITYSLVSSPISSEISIDVNTGIISASSLTASGTYNITVTATNSIGNTNANYTITIDAAIAPTALTYTPNTLSLGFGQSGNSVAPVTDGTQPITYTMTVNPGEAGITINSSTGVISANSSVPQGTYNLDVTATNSVGSQNFTSVYTINIGAPLVSFATDILPIIQANCNNCHTSGPQTLYTDYTNAFNNASQIYDRITRTQGSAGFMPKLGTALTQAEQDLVLQWINDGRQP